MSLLVKIGFFVLYLVAYVLWLIASYYLSKKLNKDLFQGNTGTTSTLTSLLGHAGFFVFIFLLSGFWNWQLALLLLGGSLLGIVVSAILWGFLGSTKNLGPRSYWSGAEFGMKHPVLMISIQIYTVLLVVAFPIIAGIVFFTYEYPSSELTGLIFRYTTVWMILVGYPLLMTVLIGSLVSENLDEETRTRFFTTQLSGLIPTAVFLALIFWSFDISGIGFQFSIGEVSLTFSPKVFLILIVYFVILVLLPYLIGVRRARKWRVELSQRQHKWLGKYLEVIQLPSSSRYDSRLRQLEAEVEDEIDDLFDQDTMIVLADELDQGYAPPNGFEEMAKAYNQSRHLDPRFDYLDWLRQFLNEIDEATTDLEKVQSDEEAEKIIQAWNKVYLSRKDKVSKEIEALEKRKPPVLAGVGAVLAPIISVVLSELGKWAWEIIREQLAR